MPNQKLPFVSVCIPVYNGENYLLESINSALGQNYPDLELLIVDNCSTDKTETIVRGLNDFRVRYFRNKKNIGSIGNFNKCIELAKGKYFLLLPHDDKLLPDSIIKYVKGLENPQVGLVYSSIRVVDSDGAVICNQENHDEDKLFSSEELVNNIVQNFNPIQLAMSRTSILKSLGGFEIKYGVFTDAHLWLKVAFDGWKAQFHKEPLFCHRKHAEQGQVALTNSNLKILSEHWVKKIDKYFWRENSYNHLLLKLSNYILSELEVHHYDSNRAKIKLLKIFVCSHFRSILKAMLQLNFHVLMQELLIIKPLIKLYGFQNIMLFYPLEIAEFTLRKLDNKLNSYLKKR